MLDEGQNYQIAYDLKILNQDKNSIKPLIESTFKIQKKDALIDHAFKIALDYPEIRSIGTLIAMGDDERDNVLLLNFESIKQGSFIRWLIQNLSSNKEIFKAFCHVIEGNFTINNVGQPVTLFHNKILKKPEQLKVYISSTCYLTDSDFPDQVVELVQCDMNRWREVALLAGAKAARGSESSIWLLAGELCHKNYLTDDISDIWCAHIAGQALAESANLKKISNRNIEKINRIKKWLIHIMRGNHLPPVERARAGNVLGQLGDYDLIIPAT